MLQLLRLLSVLVSCKFFFYGFDTQILMQYSALSFVSLVVVSVFIARHRAADGHNRPGSAPPVAIVSKAGLRRENEELRRNQLEMQQRMLALQQQNAGNRLSGSAPEVQVNGADDNIRYA